MVFAGWKSCRVYTYMICGWIVRFKRWMNVFSAILNFNYLSVACVFLEEISTRERERWGVCAVSCLDPAHPTDYRQFDCGTCPYTGSGGDKGGWGAGIRFEFAG